MKLKFNPKRNSKGTYEGPASNYTCFSILHTRVSRTTDSAFLNDWIWARPDDKRHPRDWK